MYAVYHVVLIFTISMWRNFYNSEKTNTTIKDFSVRFICDYKH